MQQPKALFSISVPFLGTNFTANPVVVGTHDALDLSNQSTYADSVLWDFGDQNYSNAFNASYAYSNPGSYTITLTVFNHTGTKNSYFRVVQVEERAVKTITISQLYLNRLGPFYNHTHTFSKADLWLEIKFDQHFDSLAADGSSLAERIYQSPAFQAIDSGYHGNLTYQLPLSPAVIVNYPVHDNAYPIFPFGGRGTIVELWGRDDSGTYLMGTSLATGLHLLSGGGNPATSDNFDLGFSVPDGTLANQVKLDCIYR